jgi:hypothetical protein
MQEYFHGLDCIETFRLRTDETAEHTQIGADRTANDFHGNSCILLGSSNRLPLGSVSTVFDQAHIRRIIGSIHCDGS